jgi:hypothetical protein
MSESKLEPVVGGADIQVSYLDALLFLEAGIENGHLLFEKESETSGAKVYNRADKGGI